MKIFEEDLQNMKKRRAKNITEMTDYDHFRAKISYKNSISRLNTTKYLESVIVYHRFPDNKLQKKHAF
jgi:hypothetical protein